MAGVQGRAFSQAEVARILHLLAETELSFPQIALRMGCSRSAIVAINRRFAVRRYNGRRGQWQVGTLLKVDRSILV